MVAYMGKSFDFHVFVTMGKDCKGIKITYMRMRVV
jgi:hypothetical protein